jgi:hypothetical protein
MPDRIPITLSSILAAVDTTARHAMPWIKGDVEIRALTLREFLRLTVRHPTLVEIVDPSAHRTTADEIATAVGRPAMVAVAAMGMDSSDGELRRRSDLEILHAFLSVLEITFPTRPIDDFFTERRKNGTSAPVVEVSETNVPATSSLMRLVCDASEYTVRTGRDGFALSPFELSFAIRTFAEIDRSERNFTAQAVAAAMGNEESAKLLQEII